ncbi:MAG: D-alanyl-D-alanine carboxypeptidase/D-alanyl-D-alanine-endopeptidase [Bacteroidetes bacterium]|nr:MAG: D-alanyl-D-alanine carboxypeptidase/D-alanyl-D-alanine-endopeptidase [Bacteroidota bacterium]
MKKITIIFCFLFLTFDFFGQTINQELQKAYTTFEKDSQLKHAISSLYVIDANTGQVVFDKNSQIGLAPASTQKVITSVTAFELLGKDYRYKTDFYLSEKVGSNSIIYIEPSGDPTLGSWRWEQTKEENVLHRITDAIRKQNRKISWPIIINAEGWNTESIPDGWMWQDIGNYYGAGANVLNWRENQFDLVLKSGSNVGDAVSIAATIPAKLNMNFESTVMAAPKQTGDNAYIYFQPSGGNYGIVRGTIPVNENKFIISGAMLSPESQFLSSLIDSIRGWYVKPESLEKVILFKKYEKNVLKIHSEVSPSLDSIIYWFLKKSINLYGEALIKTLAYERKGIGSTDSGVVVVQNFWKEKGLPEDELNIVDGSGLSPLNRVTTHSQVEILKYAKTKDWFPDFYNALPEYNGMSMKSGTIRDVKGFCGYHKAKNGKEYIFSFLVNNYNGSASSLINKMYKVLDILK